MRFNRRAELRPYIIVGQPDEESRAERNAAILRLTLLLSFSVNPSAQLHIHHVVPCCADMSRRKSRKNKHKKAPSKQVPEEAIAAPEEEGAQSPNPTPPYNDTHLERFKVPSPTCVLAFILMHSKSTSFMLSATATTVMNASNWERT